MLTKNILKVPQRGLVGVVACHLVGNSDVVEPVRRAFLQQLLHLRLGWQYIFAEVIAPETVDVVEKGVVPSVPPDVDLEHASLLAGHHGPHLVSVLA